MESPAQLHHTTARLGTDPIGKLLFRLSLPSVTSMIAISLYNLVDSFWVAKLGYQSLAALTILLPFWVICVAIGAGSGIGANALASRRFGERKLEDANTVAGQTFFLSLAIGGIITILIQLFAWQILLLCGAPPDIIEPGKRYLMVLSWGMPLLLFNTMSRGVLHASGDTLQPMIFTLISQACNMILDPLFIFGRGPFPEMGIAGAAVATVISMSIGVILSCYWLFAGRSAYQFKPHHFKPNWKVMANIYRVGLPSILMEGSEGIVIGIFFNVVGTFGSLVVAGMGIAGRISDFSFMFILGTGQGLLPIIGFSYGARLWRRLWGAVKIAALSLAAIMAIFTIILEVFTPQVIGLFSSDPELLKIAVPGMRIFVSTMILYGPTVVFITTFQGLSRGVPALVLALTRQAIIFIPAIFLFSKYLGLTGVWLSLPASDVFGFLVTGLWMYFEYRRQKKSGYWKQIPEL